MQRIFNWIHWLIISVTLGFVASTSADEKPLTPAESEMKAAWQAALQVVQHGPANIVLRDQASLKLPEGYGFIPEKEAARTMKAMGNATDERFIGLIIPMNDSQWFVTVDYESAGYIKDDDAKHWKSDELLDNLKEGTEEGNKRRESMGIPPLKVTRWIEAPHYDGASHHLIWSAELKLKNQDDPDPTINYNTYVLGREGYISMDLVTQTSTVENDKVAAQALLAATEFNSGKRYADFNSSTDKIAEYGLAALVGGVALKKLGLLALLGGLLVKFKALLIAVVAVVGGFFKRLFGKKDEPQPAATESSGSFTPQLPSSTSSTSNTSSDDKPAS